MIKRVSRIAAALGAVALGASLAAPASAQVNERSRVQSPAVNNSANCKQFKMNSKEYDECMRGGVAYESTAPGAPKSTARQANTPPGAGEAARGPAPSASTGTGVVTPRASSGASSDTTGMPPGTRPSNDPPVVKRSTAPGAPNTDAK